MRKIVHLSDLHFGSADARLVPLLAKTVRDMKPDAVVISGDLTQRAKKEEFRAAREFIDELPVPRIIVPGNHDIAPLYDLRRRFIDPYHAWRTYIETEPEVSFTDDEVAIFGVNTTHPWSVRDGRVGTEQAERLRQAFFALDPRIVKIVVAHHPFDVPEGHPRRVPRGARMLMETLAHSGVDLFLSGHLHRTHSGHSADRYQMADHATLLIHAGTALSTRLRNEGNSFNLLLMEKPSLTVLSYTWDSTSKTYEALRKERFAHGEAGWRREE